MHFYVCAFDGIFRAVKAKESLVIIDSSRKGVARQNEEPGKFSPPSEKGKKKKRSAIVSKCGSRFFVELCSIYCFFKLKTIATPV